MPNPNDLKLNTEQIEGDFENMPTGMSSVLTPPQPGIYVFQLPPAEIIYNAFDEVQHAKQGQRLQLTLRDEAALKNLTLDGQPYHANLSNVTRTINFKSGPVVVSDMAMLLKALGITPETMNNPGFAQAFVNAGGMTFKGEHTLTSYCNENRDIYKDNSQQKGKKGCGQRFAAESYQPKSPPGARVVLAIPREKEHPSLLQTQFECVCGASLRAWGRLRGFKAAQ